MVWIILFKKLYLTNIYSLINPTENKLMKSILIIFTSIVLVTTLSAQSLFEMDNIATIEIYFSQDNWNQLMIDNYETEEYLISRFSNF